MLVLDHDRAGGYWGSVYVFTAIKGLQVIIDGPVGCENLPVTSVLHYTDALPPHELPIVVTGLVEEELGQHGTEGAMKRAHETLDPDLPSVVVTGSIAEMIGGGVTPEGTDIQRFLPRTIDEDQWQSADRAHVLAVDANSARRRQSPKRKARARPARSRASTSSARSTAPSTCRPIWPRSAAWSKASAPRSTWSSRSAAIWPTSPKLADADVNICMYREFGRQLCEALERPYLQAPIGLHSTTKFLRTLGRDTGSRSRALHRAREAHDDQAAVGSVALGDAGLLRHRELRHRRQRNLCARRAAFPRRRNGPALHLRHSRAAPGEKTDNAAVRKAVQETAPLILFGSYNERMYLAEAGGRAIYIPASFPGAIIRRHTGTPFMGYAGATYLVQEVCNALFDALFNILPLGTELDKVEATPARLHREIAWDDAANIAARRARRSDAGAGAHLGGQAPARRRRARGARRRRRQGDRGARRTRARPGDGRAGRMTQRRPTPVKTLVLAGRRSHEFRDLFALPSCARPNSNSSCCSACCSRSFLVATAAQRLLQRARSHGEAPQPSTASVVAEARENMLIVISYALMCARDVAELRPGKPGGTPVVTSRVARLPPRKACAAMSNGGQ